MYGFSKAALTEQTNIRFDRRLRTDVLMHERIEHERKTELYGVLLLCIIAVQQKLTQSFEISIPYCLLSMLISDSGLIWFGSVYLVTTAGFVADQLM